MGWFDKGSNDKGQNKGQVDTNKFDNDPDRKKYQAGWNEQQKKQQQEQQNRK